MKLFRRIKLAILKAIRLGFRLVLLIGLLWVAFFVFKYFNFLGNLEDTQEPPVVLLPFSKVPGLSSEVKAAKDVLFALNSNTVAYDPRTGIGRYHIHIPETVTISKKSADLAFYADAEMMNSLVGELQYLQSQRGALWADELGKGVYEGGENLVKDFWEMIRHPIETAKGIGSGFKATYEYVVQLAKGDALPLEDLKAFVLAFYENRKGELSAEHGVEYGMTLVPETEQALGVQVNALLSGEGIFEIASLLVAATKAGKLTKLKKLPKGDGAGGKVDDLLANKDLFKSGPRILRNRQKKADVMEKSVKVLQTSSQKVGKAADPRYLRELGGEVPENKKFREALFQIYHAEEYGGNASTIIRDGLKKQGIDRDMPDYHHSPELVAKQLEEAYQQAKEWGVFDDPQNLARYRNGKAPIITKGPYKGETVHVDHIVPRDYDSRLSRNMGNLRLLPESVNTSLGNKMDADAVEHLERFQKKFKDLKNRD